jgi:hypothetical protein
MAKLVVNDHRVSRRGILLALVPPAFALGLGSALMRINCLFASAA